ncbi:MAG: pyridoxamine 5'-phosphate oxidase [Planctomycetes bacterium]|nr:pyridoxamine 5'-phosphate oxidase [Planctomycetota bacterium]
MSSPLDQVLSRFALTQSLPEELPVDPFPTFVEWYTHAVTHKIQPNPNAMTLCTVDPDGGPSSRIVLCRNIDAARGVIHFYTNYTSRKSKAMLAHPRVSLQFHWDTLDRQVRIEGLSQQASAAQSDAYFAARPWESRLGAWSSDQSQPITGRQALIDKVRWAIEHLKLDPAEIIAKGNAVHIPRPPHWGGWNITAERVELWLGGTGRVHDRAVWTRAIVQTGETVHWTEWARTRLQP